MELIFGTCDSRAQNQFSLCEAFAEDYFSKYPGMVEVFAFNQARISFLSGDNATFRDPSGEHSIFLIGNIIDYETFYWEMLAKAWKPNASERRAAVFLYGYLRDGEKFLAQIHGSFVAIIFNHTNSKLTIINDRYGTRSLFFMYKNERLHFCSRFQAITKISTFNPELNPTAISDYFLAGVVLEEKTFFKNINNMPPATILTYECGKLSKQRYPFISDNIPEDISISDAAEFFYSAFQDSVQSLVQEFDIGLMNLTGGSDTRLILAALATEQRQSILFETIDSPAWSGDSSDLQIARALCDKFRLQHSILPKPNYDLSRTPMAEFAYKFGWLGKHRLCGSYGTELLGGGSLQVSPYLHEQEINRRRLLLYQGILQENFSQSHYSTLQEITCGIVSQQSKFKTYTYASPAFWRSFYTSIYARNCTYTWIAPYCLNQSNKILPFLNTKTLSVLLNLPSQPLQPYKIYDHLYKTKLADYAKIPFHSSLVYHSHGFATLNPTNISERTKSQVDYSELANVCLDMFQTAEFDFIQFKVVKKLLASPSLIGFAARWVDFSVWYRRHILNPLSEGPTTTPSQEIFL